LVIFSAVLSFAIILRGLLQGQNEELLRGFAGPCVIMVESIAARVEFCTHPVAAVYRFPGYYHFFCAVFPRWDFYL